MYIGLQGMSFLLRDNPDGYINANVVAIVTWQFGPIPRGVHRPGCDGGRRRIPAAQDQARMATPGNRFL